MQIGEDPFISDHFLKKIAEKSKAEIFKENEVKKVDDLQSDSAFGKVWMPYERYSAEKMLTDMISIGG